MTDIFLSYAHEDRSRARPVVEMIEDEGWSVWWDRGIEPGMKWLPALSTELANCRSVMVLWSKNSSGSEWVHREAREGIKKDALVPVSLDSNSIPEEFSERQATDFSHWNGERDLTEVQTLFRRIAALVPPSRIDTVRPGYKAGFLGNTHEIPLPGVTGPAAVLRYNHFTVVMNPARRLAHYSAYNLDSTQLVYIKRPPDKWLADPLLPGSLQVEASMMRANPYDRGTLTPRSTVSWGDERQALIATRQVFYWPNLAPQHQKLNRVWWLALENWERDVAGFYKRMTGFTGPVFSDNDEPFRGEMHLEDGLIALDTFRIPRAYWKVVVVVTPEGEIRKSAHLMDQDEMLNVSSRDFSLPDYRISLQDLEQRTHLRFGEILHKAADIDFQQPQRFFSSRNPSSEKRKSRIRQL